MDKISFKTKVYDLKNAINASSVRLQASVIKGDASFEEIIDEATGANEIRLIDGETGATKAVYIGFTKPVAFSFMLDDFVSVELENTDILTKIEIIEAKTADNAQEIAAVNDSVTALSDEMSSSVSNIQSEIGNLNETQLSQDAAIEDLASLI